MEASSSKTQFHELAHECRFFNDPNKRASYIYERYRTIISSMSNAEFSGYEDSCKGFYNVYSDIFDRICEIEAGYSGWDSITVPPAMGNMDSTIGEVKRFYDHWLGFSTVMKFGFDDEKMELKSRKEYNESVRKLAMMVKKQDKRVSEKEEKEEKKYGRTKKDDSEEVKEKMHKVAIEKAKMFKRQGRSEFEEKSDEGRSMKRRRL